jgi:hypothetical protein
MGRWSTPTGKQLRFNECVHGFRPEPGRERPIFCYCSASWTVRKNSAMPPRDLQRRLPAQLKTM